jgi:NAD+ synthase
MPFNLEKEYLLKLYKNRIERLKDYVKINNLHCAVIGLSGGLDSTLTSFMLKDVIGSENIYPIMLPSYESSDSSIQDAKEVIKILEIPEENTQLIEIGDIVKFHLSKAGMEEGNIEPMVKGNISARVRMIQLFAKANMLFYNGKRTFVEGTENESEYRTGYFTKYGDAGTDFEAMKGLYKTQVRDIAKILGVPEKIIKKKPSAELVAGQTDEGELGISYEDLDNILFSLFNDKNPELLLNYPKEKVERTIQLVENSSHKRDDNEEPYILDEAKKFIETHG